MKISISLYETWLSHECQLTINFLSSFFFSNNGDLYYHRNDIVAKNISGGRYYLVKERDFFIFI